MTVTPEQETEIRRLYGAEHWKVGTIAHQLHVHHDVVRRVLGLLPKRKRKTPARSRKPQRCDAYREFIDQQLAQYPRLRATRLYDMIRERGYTGGALPTRQHSMQSVREFTPGIVDRHQDPARRLGYDELPCSMRNRGGWPIRRHNASTRVPRLRAAWRRCYRSAVLCGAGGGCMRLARP
jgi:hypothetical protein